MRLTIKAIKTRQYVKVSIFLGGKRYFEYLCTRNFKREIYEKTFT